MKSILQIHTSESDDQMFHKIVHFRAAGSKVHIGEAEVQVQVWKNASEMESEEITCTASPAPPPALEEGSQGQVSAALSLSGNWKRPGQFLQTNLFN